MDLCITTQDTFAFEPPKDKAFTPITSSTTRLPPTQTLSFNLLIHDPNLDSSLTHPWDVPDDPLTIPLGETRMQLLARLRTHLPRKTRKLPRLVTATLYWTYKGGILPLGEDEQEWHYRNAITKTDLLGRTEGEWFLLKEMMASSGGALRCYLGIRGEAEKEKKGWWFGNAST